MNKWDLILCISKSIFHIQISYQTLIPHSGGVVKILTFSEDDMSVKCHKMTKFQACKCLNITKKVFLNTFQSCFPHSSTIRTTFLAKSTSFLDFSQTLLTIIAARQYGFKTFSLNNQLDSISSHWSHCSWQSLPSSGFRKFNQYMMLRG